VKLDFFWPTRYEILDEETGEIKVSSNVKFIPSENYRSFKSKKHIIQPFIVPEEQISTVNVENNPVPAGTSIY